MPLNKWEAEVYIGVVPRAGLGTTATLLNITNTAAEETKTLYADLHISKSKCNCASRLEEGEHLWKIITGSATMEFCSSSAIVKDDACYTSSIKKILRASG